MSTPNMSHHQFAIWGAFLLEGMLEAEMKLPKGVSLRDYWESGQLELVSEMTRHIETLAQVATQLPEWGNEVAGVFEYEVVSALGAFLAEHLITHQALPKDEDIHAAITHLVLTFFSEGVG